MPPARMTLRKVLVPLTVFDDAAAAGFEGPVHDGGARKLDL